MQSFKLFLEYDLSSFVSTMIDNRYDHGPRLVAADWLEEQGESDLFGMIRAASNGDFGLFNKLSTNIEKQQKITINSLNHSIQDQFSNYNLRADGVYEYEFVDERFRFVKINPKELPHSILCGILILLSYRMMIKIHGNANENVIDVLTGLERFSREINYLERDADNFDLSENDLRDLIPTLNHLIAASKNGLSNHSKSRLRLTSQRLSRIISGLQNNESKFSKEVRSLNSELYQIANK